VLVRNTMRSQHPALTGDFFSDTYYPTFRTSPVDYLRITTLVSRRGG
jgi:hypothetical protein